MSRSEEKNRRENDENSDRTSDIARSTRLRVIASDEAREEKEQPIIFARAVLSAAASILAELASFSSSGRSISPIKRAISSAIR